MAKRKLRREAKRGRGSCSSEAADSNAMILPLNKTNQKKHMNKEKAITKEYPKQSKSQLRKLKKLEEEKEMVYMSLKAQENLEKYKISVGLYNVLEASKDMGKVQTRREKKRNAIHLSKEGLLDPQTHRLSKKRREGDASGYIELELSKIHARQPIDENDLVQSTVVNKEVLDYVINGSSSLGSFLWPFHSDKLGTNDEPVATKPCEEVSNRDRGTSMQQDIRIDTTASSIHDVGYSYKSMKVLDKSSRVDSSRTIDLPGSLHRPLMAPTVVHVSRPNEVENKRKDLPIVMMEQEIMEAVNNNPAVIICGETGCGKTTQVPQFLYEASFGSNKCSFQSGIIGITQPRHVAPSSL